MVCSFLCSLSALMYRVDTNPMTKTKSSARPMYTTV